MSIRTGLIVGFAVSTIATLLVQMRSEHKVSQALRGEQFEEPGDTISRVFVATGTGLVKVRIPGADCVIDFPRGVGELERGGQVTIACKRKPQAPAL